MFQRIPPVGNPIAWRHGSPPPRLARSDEKILFFQSGTAALAQALIIAKATQKTNTPEVIVPGYACPDIISAAVYAGVTPVLVDLEPNLPHMSISGIESLITKNTIAIIAINFMGIPERIADIRSLIEHKNITLIEDSAQWFPDTTKDQYVSDHYLGDLVIISFGKGKPISLMGGGLLIVKKNMPAPPGTELQSEPDESTGPLSTNLKTQLLFSVFNIAISGYGYWLLELLPWIKLGKTHFRELDELRVIDNNRLGLLSENITQYQKRPTTTQDALKKILGTSKLALEDLPSQCDTYHGQRLLRYPLLFPQESDRNNVLSLLSRRGCGASALYQSALPDIPGVLAKISKPSSLPNANSFANRLLTLPTHTNVSQKHITLIQEALTYCE